MVPVAAISGSRIPADVGAKPLAGPRLRELLCRAGARNEDGDRYGAEEFERAEVRQVLSSGSLKGAKIKAILPVLMILSQVMGADGAEGLGMAMVAGSFEETFFSILATLAVGVVFSTLFLGVPWVVYSGARAVFQKSSHRAGG